MSILCDHTTRVLVQGTGRAGRFHAEQCIDYGTEIVAGVAPGKAGQDFLGRPTFDTVRDAVAKSWMDAEAYALNTYQTVSRLLAGGSIGAEASLNKIFWSELDVHMDETALGLLGERAELLAIIVAQVRATLCGTAVEPPANIV